MLQFISYLLVLTVGMGIGIWLESISTREEKEAYQEIIGNQEERLIKHQELKLLLEKELYRLDQQHKENIEELVEDNIRLRKKLNNAQR